MTSRRTMYKHYAQGVIAEMLQMGYFNGRAKEVFLGHYKYMKRIFELEPKRFCLDPCIQREGSDLYDEQDSNIRTFDVCPVSIQLDRRRRNKT